MNLEYAAEAVILGFQHYIVMLGTSVIITSALVPQMGGGNVSIFESPPHHVQNLNMSKVLNFCCGIAFLPGGEGSGDPDAAVRRRHQHLVPVILWDSSPRSDGWILHRRRADHFHHHIQPLQQ